MAKGIYKITNDRTGEVYVGQAKNLDSRWNRHLNELVNGKHHNSGMQKDHDRGDTFSFEILEELPNATKADLYNKEAQYVKKYNCFREGYNQTPGGAMDQFKGRYEYGGGRLPLYKYKPTDSYLIGQETSFLVNFCPNCGVKVDKSSIYCIQCGKPLNMKQDEQVVQIDVNDNSFKQSSPNQEIEEKQNNMSNSKINSVLSLLLYHVEEDGYCISKTKIITLFIFLIIILGNIINPANYNTPFSSLIIIAISMGLIIAIPTYVVGNKLNKILINDEFDSNENKIKNYLFYCKDEVSNELKLSKTKCASWIFGILITVFLYLIICIPNPQEYLIGNFMICILGGAVMGIMLFILVSFFVKIYEK